MSLRDLYVALYETCYENNNDALENNATTIREARKAARALLSKQCRLASNRVTTSQFSISSLKHLEKKILDNHRDVLEQYGEYIKSRESGRCSWMFSDEMHCKWYLVQIAPTKLVDGIWLQGIDEIDESILGPDVKSNLKKIRFEECGASSSDPMNHVHIYRNLLRKSFPDTFLGNRAQDILQHPFYNNDDESNLLPGCIQMSLSLLSEEYLPELIGYNLGYEQMPLHMLITSYEMKEYSLDSFYFDLHITVDNIDCGHAKQALQATHDYLRMYPSHFSRVLTGYALSDAIPCAFEVAKSYNVGKVVKDIFARKSQWSYSLHDTLQHGQDSSLPTLGYAMRSNDGKVIFDWIVENGYFDGKEFKDIKFAKMMEKRMMGTFTKDEMLFVENWWKSYQTGVTEEEQTECDRLCSIIKRAVHNHSNISMTHPITGEIDTMDNWYRRSKDDFVVCLSTPEMRKRTLQSFLMGRMKNVRLTDDDRRFLMQWCNRYCSEPTDGTRNV